MERTEKVGLGVAAAGHVLLFGALSLGWLMRSPPPPPLPPAIDVSMVDDIGLQSQAQQSKVAPSAATAPDTGPPEEAPPPPVAKEKAPEPAPPVKQPETTPPPKPSPKPAPPQPKKEAKPTPEKAPARPKPDAASLSDVMAGIHAEGKTADARGKKQRASVLGDDFRKSLAQGVTKTNSDAPQAAKISAQALAGIVAAIKRQIQPCADRQINPGPGANEILIVLNLRLNRDGTLASTPTVVRTSGVNDDNGRYVQRVRDLGVAAFKGCSPLKLPEEYYATANGGWSNLNYNWQLR